MAIASQVQSDQFTETLLPSSESSIPQVRFTLFSDAPLVALVIAAPNGAVIAFHSMEAIQPGVLQVCVRLRRGSYKYRFCGIDSRESYSLIPIESDDTVVLDEFDPILTVPAFTAGGSKSHIQVENRHIVASEQMNYV